MGKKEKVDRTRRILPTKKKGGIHKRKRPKKSEEQPANRGEQRKRLPCVGAKEGTSKCQTRSRKKRKEPSWKKKAERGGIGSGSNAAGKLWDRSTSHSGPRGNEEDLENCKGKRD